MKRSSTWYKAESSPVTDFEPIEDISDDENFEETPQEDTQDQTEQNLLEQTDLA
jgi:hypothetical protein